MNNHVFWVLFEGAASLCENVLLVLFLHAFFARKQPGWKGIVAAIGLCGVFCLLSPFQNDGWLANWEPAITILLLIGYSLIFLNGSILARAVVSVLDRELIALANSFVITLCSAILGPEASEAFLEPSALRILVVTMSKLALFFLYKLVSGVFSRRGSLFPWQWAAIGAGFLISTAAGSLSISLIWNGVENEDNSHMQILGITGCIWALSLLVYFLTLWMMKTNEKRLRSELEDQERSFQTEQLRRTIRSNEELASIQHDMKHYLSSLQFFIERGEMEEAAQLCQEVTGRVEKVETVIRTDQPFADAVLNEKISECRRKGIDTKCSVFCKLADVDALAFSSVCGNLLDNAIEAEEHLPEGQRHIEIKLGYRSGFICLTVTNRIISSVLAQNPELKSTKLAIGEHGIGHRSVRNTLGEIGGEITYREEGDRFIASALFPQKETN